VLWSWDSPNTSGKIAIRLRQIKRSKWSRGGGEKNGCSSGEGTIFKDNLNKIYGQNPFLEMHGKGKNATLRSSEVSSPKGHDRD